MKREKAGSIVLGVWLAFVLCIKVLAANDVVVAGVCTNEKDISLYVKGLGEGIMSVSCQIGTKAGQQVEFEDAAGMENAPKTLIMVDNSLSITDSNRRKIADFLTAFVGKKEEREQIAIAVFDEKIRWLTEFTQAGQELEAAAGSITYQDQETYLTDVLYEVIKKGQLGAEDCYKKIIVISDGVDNKAIGYTKEELYGQIEEKAYPIYTLGCVYKNNEEQLKNMFALSRMTGGKDFLLDEADSMEAVADEIREDSRAVRFCIIPDAEEMDGSINQVLLTVSCADGEQKIEAGVKMPFREEEKNPETQPDMEEEYVAQPEEEGILMDRKMAVGLVIVLLAIVFLFALFFNKRKKGSLQQPLICRDDSGKDMEKTELLEEDAEKTELLIGSGEDEETQRVGNRQYVLYLTDEKNPVKSFFIPVKDAVIIGKRRQEVNLLIDYDRSVSGRHCRISRINDRFYVEDMNSTNGTMLNGIYIQGRKEIYSGCVLTIGRLDMKVEIRCE